EVLRASDWRTYQADEEIVREGEMDDRFYIIVEGRVGVRRAGRQMGTLKAGDCFGESSFVSKARRTASINADNQVTLIRVSSTLLEQVSAACQLRFNKEFLRALIERLQRAEQSQYQQEVRAAG
ncbi:MAG: cyclic nucleotide-binding domain-containing protein, partial [Pseudomonadota bacterium]